MVKTGSIELSTRGNADVQDITAEIAQVVIASESEKWDSDNLLPIGNQRVDHHRVRKRLRERPAPPVR